jgi:GDPmannose 4,6-dehydratase
VKAIKAGRQTTIQLGNLDIWRDWGWAPDYVRAMTLMLQAEQPADYLIASGNTTSLRQFAQEAFAAAGLDLANHLESLDALKRPADLSYSAMNPGLIQEKIGWQSRRPIVEIVQRMYLNTLL